MEQNISVGWLEREEEARVCVCEDPAPATNYSHNLQMKCFVLAVQHPVRGGSVFLSSNPLIFLLISLHTYMLQCSRHIITQREDYICSAGYPSHTPQLLFDIKLLSPFE